MKIGFLVTAYLVVWSGVFAYVAYNAGRLRRLAQRLEVIEEILAEKGGEQDA